MTRWVTSALVTAIKGRFHGDVFQMWKGLVVSRRGTFPRQPRTLRQTSTRTNVSYIAGCWSTLSDQQKYNWAYYADQLPTRHSGFNAYLSRNVIILEAEHPSLVGYQDPREVPEFPVAPVGFTVSFLAGPARTRLTWSTPNDSSLFVQAYFSPVTGYRDDTSPISWFIGSVCSTYGQLLHTVSDYQTNNIGRYWIRAVNTWGEVSVPTSLLARYLS